MLNESMEQFLQMMPREQLPQISTMLNTGTVAVHAGDLKNGLGWFILALGVGVAMLPIFAPQLKADLLKKLILGALAVGAFLLVYVLSDAVRYASLGIILALAGYALEFIGTLKERPPLR